MHRLRTPIVLLLLAFAAAFLAACGGGGAENEDPDKLLQQTFASGKKVDSGRVALALRIDNARGSSSVRGPVSVRLSGPFVSEGQGKLPRFSLALTLQGSGQSLTAGGAVTGDKGYVSFQGQDYVVSDALFAQFKRNYERAQADSRKRGDANLQTLGLRPREWLENARNEGTVDVGGTETVKITGAVDVPKLLEDVNTALERATRLGLSGAGQLPKALTDEQRRAFAESVRDARVEIYTGADDKILRRLKVALGIRVPEARRSAGSLEAADVAFDLTLTELNEDQEIEAPKDPKPFEQLLGALGMSTGGAGGAGGTPPTGGAGGTPPTGGAGGTPPTGGAERAYQRCLQEAGSDLAAAQKCASLLSR